MDFVRGQIVQNQRVASPQTRNEHLLEIHPEDRGSQWPLHQKQSGDSFVAQDRQKPRTLPMTVGDGTPATFAPGAAAIQTGQLEMEARFVNKHQTADVPSRWRLPPQGACPLNVAPVWLGGARRFFIA